MENHCDKKHSPLFLKALAGTCNDVYVFPPGYYYNNMFNKWYSPLKRRNENAQRQPDNFVIV
jgi:hypothetical protein